MQDTALMADKIVREMGEDGESECVKMEERRQRVSLDAEESAGPMQDEM